MNTGNQSLLDHSHPTVPTVGSARGPESAPKPGHQFQGWGLPLGLAGVAFATLTFGVTCASAQETPAPRAVEKHAAVIAITGDEPEAKSDAKDKREKRIIIRTLESPDAMDLKAGDKEVAWLGVGTEELSEALTAQLKLDAGLGLLVTYVANDSPAARAGIQKNDVLLEYDGQRLVLPAQFRKLVQLGKEGDEVKITLLRGGEKESVTAKLGKTRATPSVFGEQGFWPNHLPALQHYGGEIGEAVRKEVEALRKSLAASGIDKEHLRIEIQRNVEDARKSIEDALRSGRHATGPAARALTELGRRGVEIDKDAHIVIRKDTREVRTTVKTDDSGTYVVVATPEKRLTATDKNGKALFEGLIETREQQEKVPRAVWEKVQPMLEEMEKNRAPEAEESEQSATETTDENT